MKKNLAKIISLIFAICLMSTLLVIPASADDSQAQRWNIMLVIDGSGSLTQGDKATDPDGLRFEAIDAFVDVIPENGNYVGAIVFTANMTQYDDENSMYEGICLDTWKNGPVALKNNKATLKNQIKNADTFTTYKAHNGETDIGTAMLYAEKRLEEAQKVNGLPCAVFLFTDGANEVEYDLPERKSEENMKTAEQKMLDNDMTVCGVCLNASDSISAITDVRDIVCAANGIDSGSWDLGNYYVEIKNAKECAASTDKLLGLITGAVPPEDETFTESKDFSFRVPGVGVEEVNVRFRTPDGKDLPAGMSVTVTDPTGNSYSGAAVAAHCLSGKTYQIYKFSQPSSGTWKVHVELPTGNTIAMNYSPVFSVDIDAEMDSDPVASDLHSKMNVKVDGFLAQGGQRLTNPDAYNEYDCQLELTNSNTGEVKIFPIAASGNNQYSMVLPLDFYGTFDARIAFICDKVSAVSELSNWVLDNHAPTVPSNVTKIEYTWFEFAGANRNLLNYATDLEDGDNITFAIGSSNMAGVSINGTKLHIKPFEAKSGQYIVIVSDMQNATSQLNIKLVNATWKYLAIGVAALLIIATLVILFIRVYNSFTPNGVCTLEFDVPDNDGVSSHSLNIELTPPGRGTKRKTNLFELLSTDLTRQAGAIRSACIEENVNIENVERFIEEISSGLEKIAISCVVGKEKKTRIGKVKVTQGKKKTVLFNNAMKVVPNGNAMSFGYYLREEENDMDDYYESSDDYSYQQDVDTYNQEDEEVYSSYSEVESYNNSETTFSTDDDF